MVIVKFVNDFKQVIDYNSKINFIKKHLIDVHLR